MNKNADKTAPDEAIEIGHKPKKREKMLFLVVD
jgi:hypothetical protein